MTTPEQPDLQGVLERRLQAERAAVQAVRRQRKGLTLAQATDVVLSVLTEWDLRGTRTDAEQTARLVLDPNWVWKHPIQAHREGWRVFPRD